MKRLFTVLIMFSGLVNLFGCNSVGSRAGGSNGPGSVLTKETLDALPDDLLEQTVYENIYQLIGEDTENQHSNALKLTKGQQAILSTWMVEAEVNNGGFNQFYFNSSGEYADMAVDGFETVGAKKFAELMREANKVYASIQKDLEKFDDGSIESFSASYKDNPLNNLDTRFYDLGKSESLWALKIKYIRENTDQFIRK